MAMGTRGGTQLGGWGHGHVPSAGAAAAVPLRSVLEQDPSNKGEIRRELPPK